MNPQKKLFGSGWPAVAQGLGDPVQHVGSHFIAIALIEQFVPGLRVNIQVQALAASVAQGVGQIFQTFAFAHRITFAANYQQRQARIDLGEIGRFADLLQAAEQIDP
jgi:hypothetical protein